MKILAALALLVIMATTVVAQESGRKPRSRVAEQFEHIAQEWMAGYNSPDAGNLKHLYAEHAQYISSHVPGLVAAGRDALLSNFQKGINMGGHLDGIEVLSVTHSCDVATVLCRYDANNSGEKVSGRTLLVLQRIDGTWVIVLHMTVI